ncbi:MAG: xanthine dehydrogenase family protein subunit M [Alphaproteobacteria bacterium]|nr:xanthine dehydrogenase family protein subunit M [Alphaproteobacteria bacterium]
MKPPPFAYVTAESIEHAVAELARSDGEGKLVAGGQSLMPMLNFRLLEPSVLIDIGKIPDLTGISETGDGLSIGALTRHVDLETSHLIAQRFPVLTEAVKHVAHIAIRNRGTFGGSLCHADPAAELPMMAVLLDARICVSGQGGNRQIPADKFFLGALTTDLEEEEIVTRIDLPYLPESTGWGFEEISRRSGDFALAAAAATVSLVDGKISEVRLAVTGVDDLPLRIRAAEDALRGSELDDAVFSSASQIVRDAVNPNSDVHASADYRRHLIGVLVGRVLRSARSRARGGA